MRTYDAWFPRYALGNGLMFFCRVFSPAVGRGSSALSTFLDRRTQRVNYSSSMFLVTKKSGGKRPVLNLKPLNKFVPNQTFKMEGIHLLKDFLKPNYFMTKLDLSDAYYSIPIDKHSRHYLQFIFEGKLY